MLKTPMLFLFAWKRRSVSRRCTVCSMWCTEFVESRLQQSLTWGLSNLHLLLLDRLITIGQEGRQDEEAGFEMTDIHPKDRVWYLAGQKLSRNHQEMSQRKSFWAYWQGSDYQVSKNIREEETKPRSFKINLGQSEGNEAPWCRRKVGGSVQL